MVSRWPFGSKRAGAAVAACVALAASLALAHPARAAVVQVHLTAHPAVVRVAPGVRMRAWTYNGRVPAPTIRVRQGDVVNVTLRNAERRRHGKGMWHSVDFHAAQIAPNVGFAPVPPGHTHTFSFVANHPGVYIYHCGTAPMLEHVGMGMYGAIIVDPAVPRPPATEVTIVQSEFYGKVRHGVLHSSLRAMRRERPRFMAFNGRAMRYVRHPIHVPVGGLVRIYFVDAGPTLFSAFHVIGNMFETVEPDGNPDNQQHWVSTQVVAPGGAAVFELRFPQAGTYPFVSHSLLSADAGAMGRFVAR